MRVFVTHGHNEIAKEKIKNFLSEQLGHEPVVLNEQRGIQGMTIIEALEEFSKGCEFAVILLTGDDMTPDGGLRARQNVVHEAGFFQGRLGRSKVVLIIEKGVEIPSNLSGLLPLEYKKDVKEISNKLKGILETTQAKVEHDYEKLQKTFRNICLKWEIPASITVQEKYRNLYPRMFQGNVLSPVHLHTGAERLNSMLGRTEWTPDLLVGLNEGGMIVAAFLHKNIPASVGVVKTKKAKVGSKKIVDFISLPERADSRPIKKILVIDSKLKTGASLKAVDKKLRERFSGDGDNVEVYYGIILAYQQTRFKKIHSDRPWFVRFCEFGCYVVFYIDMDPNQDHITETVLWY